jgi:hypothetical protein
MPMREQRRCSLYLVPFEGLAPTRARSGGKPGTRGQSGDKAAKPGVPALQNYSTETPFQKAT